jgi:hypothetical protein
MQASLAAQKEARLPPEQTQLPLEQTQLPLEAEQLPLEAKQLPLQAKQLPLEAAEPVQLPLETAGKKNASWRRPPCLEGRGGCGGASEDAHCGSQPAAAGGKRRRFPHSEAPWMAGRSGHYAEQEPGRACLPRLGKKTR